MAKFVKVVAVGIMVLGMGKAIAAQSQQQHAWVNGWMEAACYKLPPPKSSTIGEAAIRMIEYNYKQPFVSTELAKVEMLYITCMKAAGFPK